MTRLIECVPNFSEGRRSEVIEEIVAAIQKPDIQLLDVSSDPDHNRTVVTFAGEPQSVIDAAFLGIEAAAHLIDLTTHEGQHPRLGAADVVPLVPLRNITLEECAGWARQLGERVGSELTLPVYLYEAAANRPERVNLADVRRGGYEKLRETIQNDPLRTPDFGPAEVGPAGAVVVGARGPLIAFNAYLNTDDVQLARQIARQVRASSGGLPFLKAIGLLVDGRAQVSMNVVDFKQTSLYEVLEAVRAAAQDVGATVVETELVGLVPQAALMDAARSYLGLPTETRMQTIEHRLGNCDEVTFE